MKGSYSAEDVQVFLTTTDRITGEVTQHVEITDFADCIESKGLSYIYGLVRKEGETDSEFKQRILDTQKELK